MKKAAFIGTGKIREVYPEALVAQMKSEMDFSIPEILTPANLEKYASRTKEITYLFSTWGMPSLTGEQIDTYFPALRAVFYAAGTVQAFARPFIERGIAVFSANYRFLPITDHDSAPRRAPIDCAENDVPFPVFIEDCAKAFRYMMTEGKQLVGFDRAFIGGSSAGGYISMMLCFDPHYLRAVGYDSFRDVAGYVFDAGQPTTHFHLLELRDESALRVLIDETAPFFYLTKSFRDQETLPRLKFVTAEQDMPGRVEQNALFAATLRNFDYPAEKIESRLMAGYGHCKYLADPDYIEMIGDFLTK